MVFETWLKSDLKKPLVVEKLKGNFFSGDVEANRIGVEVFDNGSPATLSGQVLGYLIRSDGATVIVEGTLSTNKASILLPSYALNIPGWMSIVIKVGSVSVGACTVYVYRSTTDELLDPEHIIPSIEELFEMIEECEQAVQTKADKVTNATNNHFASLDGNGNLKDSGKTASDFLASTLKGSNNGVAELDANGKVPSAQLPSYVDDVLEYDSLSAFPATGETGKIYVAKDTNKTYRWSGSAYIEISPSLALGETSSTAYRGDRGKAAYDHATDSGRITTATASGFYKIAVTSEGHVAGASAVQKADITALGIPAQDTTYESKPATSGGTDESLVTTGEKYTWNQKYDKPSGGIPASDIASGVIPDVSGKADKVSNATSGHLAGLDANGNLTDSGSSASDFDEVLEFASESAFPATGTAGKIYVAKDVNELFRWDVTLSGYVSVGGGSTGGSSSVYGVNFSIATTDWTAVTDGYDATVVNANISVDSEEIVLYDASIDANLESNITYDKTAASHLITFHVSVMPVGAISGRLLIITPSLENTYQDFGGATSQADGSHGLVPAPLIADKDKFLKGDGTWGNTPQRSDSSIIDLVYPVGSIYMSVSSTSPATLFGGTWSQLEDRFLVGAGSVYTAGDTGGSATHTLTTAEMPSHNHTFTGSEVTSGNQTANHTHTYTDYYATTTGGTAITIAQLASHDHSTNIYSQGSGNSRNRTVWDANGSNVEMRAGANGSNNTHTHTGANTNTSRTSNDNSANHAHKVTASGSIGSTGSGTAFSTLPPYLAVYMWKRTA